MIDNLTLWNKLKAPFDPARVSWRVGSTTADKSKGMALAYIDARDVMERLDDACGAGGWQCRYPHANGKTVCEIGILVTRGVQHGQDFWDGWVWKADGAGDTDFEAEKGALSDAFKRAAVRWGIGRYLYDTPTIWVAIEQKGKSFVIKESEFSRLTKLLTGKLDKAGPHSPDNDVQRDPQSDTAVLNGTPGASKAKARATYELLVAAMRTTITRDAQREWLKLNRATIDGLPADWMNHFDDAYQAHKDSLEARAA